MPSNHPIYSKDASVFLETGPDKLAALQQAITNSGFLDNVEQVYLASGKTRDQFQIAVKPNIMTGSINEYPSPVYTDPEMVEYLFDRLRDKGFTKLAIVESHNVYDYSYQGRTVQAVAEMAGYTGKGYDIVNLSEEKEPFDYGGVLGLHRVGRTWRDSDYRISFAKNKTHWQCFYTACLKNIYGCLPEWDKMKHYHGKRREFYQCCILMLDAFPVHFGFLDAWVSGDGFSGHVRDAHPNDTRTIIASENIVALDWVAGEKMDLDPSMNYVIQEAMKFWGTVNITRKGNMTPYHPWLNVRPIVVTALDFFEEFYWLSYVGSRTLATPQDERFKPVSRWQWFFGIAQRMTQLVEGLAVKPVKL
jgi:uncharacterized protein (DUF362 family)